MPFAQPSDVDILGDTRSVFEFDAKISQRAVHLGMAKQKVGPREGCQSCVRLKLPWCASVHACRIHSDRDQSRTSKFRTNRAYCRVEICCRSWKRLGNRNLHPSMSGLQTQIQMESRVPSETSNGTGQLVLLWITEARSRTRSPETRSTTFRRTRPQPGICYL